MGPGRLELPTSRLSGVRSNQAELRARKTATVIYTYRALALIGFSGRLYLFS